jgi:hypothetical protein
MALLAPLWLSKIHSPAARLRDNAGLIGWQRLAKSTLVSGRVRSTDLMGLRGHRSQAENFISR